MISPRFLVVFQWISHLATQSPQRRFAPWPPAEIQRFFPKQNRWFNQEIWRFQPSSWLALTVFGTTSWNIQLLSKSHPTDLIRACSHFFLQKFPPIHGYKIRRITHQWVDPLTIADNFPRQSAWFSGKTLVLPMEFSSNQSIDTTFCRVTVAPLALGPHGVAPRTARSSVGAEVWWAWCICPRTLRAGSLPATIQPWWVKYRGILLGINIYIYIYITKLITQEWTYLLTNQCN